MGEPQTEHTVTRRLVRVGLVLAVLSLVLGVLTAVPALIIGILVAVRGRGRAGAATSTCGVPRPESSACAKPTPGLSPTFFIKRVVALPGERLRIAGGKAVVDGRRLSEPYARVGEQCQTCDLPREITVPAGHYFVMGDNRGESQDSRELGPVSADAIVGRARLRYWPLGRFGSAD